MGILLILTQSRGALIGVVCATLVVVVLSNRRWWWVWLIGILAIMFMIIALNGAPVILDMLLGTSDVLGVSSLQGRLELWSRAIYMIQDFPFTGVGLGMFEPIVKLLYPTFSIAPDVVFFHAHNIYLNVAAEMGLPGLIGHLGFYLVLAVLLLRQALNGGTKSTRTLAIGLFGALLVFLIHGLFEVLTMAPRAAFMIWGLFGLMAAVGMSPKGQNDAGDAS